MSSRELLEFLEGSDDDDRDRRKRRRRKPRMWRSARERASWKSDMRQVERAMIVSYLREVHMIIDRKFLLLCIPASSS